MAASFFILKISFGVVLLQDLIYNAKKTQLTKGEIYEI